MAQKNENFDFEFTYEHKKHRVVCTRFQVGNLPQVYIPIPLPGHKTLAITFYETDEPTKYYWFELPEPKESIAKAVYRALMKLPPIITTINLTPRQRRRIPLK